MLPGEQARSIFDRSGLPNETLGRIWALVDTEQRGALSAPEFIVAMHLLTSTNSGALRTLPNVLPPAILEVAAGRATARQSPRPSPAGLPRQLTGQQRTGSPLSRGLQTGNDWLVTSADKSRFDQLYATLDKTSKGYITGEEAVPFFSQSNLSEDALAQIWDLADVNSQGHLNRDEFAVAMYLIRQQRLNSSTPLPTTLPANLVPPSMRTRQPAGGASPFDPPPMVKPPPPQPKSAMDDLFGLDTTPAPPAPPAPRQDPMSTGGSGGDPFAGGSGTPSSPNAGSSTFQAFVPSSSFGRGLRNQPTGAASSQPSATEDLLADNNPEESKKITGESTELANLSNQISTLSTQMQETQAKRTTTQNELNQSNTQKQNFQQRLAQLRQLYEKEAQDTRSLEEQLRNARTETQKLQGECMTLENTLADAKTQHQQVLTALQSDQQENGNLRERIRVANAEIAQLKPQIEKLKMEARQQKGLVAINKKQLLTTEGERDKLKTEGEGLGKAPGDAAARVADSSSAANTPSRVASPALSTSSGNNPFFKRTASTDIMGAFPTTSGPDEIFGPSGGSSQAPAPFRPQTTGTSTASAGSSFSTPPGSAPVSRQATLRADNPPPPPESRQISSSFLPFGAPAESISSSRQVSPPASRADGSVADGPSAATKDADEVDDAKTPTDSKTPTDADGKAVASPSKEKTAPFGEDDGAKAKADFDNAFAAFTSSKSTAPTEAAAPKAKSAFDSEFPPISEIERDESDSESEQGGFDDDFAPASPEKTKKAAETTADKSAEDTAAETVTKAVEPPQEEKPASPAPATTAPVAQGSSVDDIFGPSASTAATTTAPPAQQKGVFDELDDDFEGLEEAKEGSADDDFANISRSGFEDYNNVFDSPPPSQAKGDNGGFGNESSFDFIPSNPAGAESKGAESHDWDAIFAGLDSSDPAANTAADAATDGKKDDGKPSERPAAGRALTDKGVHDDPILKSLTGMGYSRTDSVAALEKYDYNLERVSTNISIFQSNQTDKP